MKITYMNPKFDKEYRKESTEAVDWLLQLKSKEMSAKKRLEFENWLSKNPENSEQFKIINALWDSTQIIKDDPFTTQVLNKRQTRNRHTNTNKNTKQVGNHSKTIRWVSIAVTVLFVVAGVFLTQRYLDSEKIYYTTTGEQQSIFLDDGSVIHLDSETNITVAFSSEQRYITMEKGRAIFSVAHDSNRVFVVTAGSINIRAIGTKFNVSKLNKTKVSVTVTEGKVQVTRKEVNSFLGKKPPIVPTATGKIAPEKQLPQNIPKRTQQPIEKKEVANMGIIAMGEKIIVDEQKNVYQVKPVDVKHASSWREGRLYFSKALLPDVIDEVNIYLKKKIVIGDSRLKDVEINMNFNIQDCKYFLSTLKDVVPIEYHTKSDNWIVITKRM